MCPPARGRTRRRCASSPSPPRGLAVLGLSRTQRKDVVMWSGLTAYLARWQSSKVTIPIGPFSPLSNHGLLFISVFSLFFLKGCSLFLRGYIKSISITIEKTQSRCVGPTKSSHRLYQHSGYPGRRLDTQAHMRLVVEIEIMYRGRSKIRCIRTRVSHRSSCSIFLNLF
jgi:hypothetical protein